jgi:hypothetical protein
MSWCLTSDAQHILAVAVDQTVHIYAQQRLQEADSDQHWVICDEMKLDRYGRNEIAELPIPPVVAILNKIHSFFSNVTAVTWAEPGVLVTVSGQTITCYSKWLTVSDKVPGKLLCMDFVP